MTTETPREESFYLARCEELVRLLLHFLEGAISPESLRFSERQRLKRLLRRLQDGILKLEESIQKLNVGL